MRALLQRVTRAAVTIDGAERRQSGAGFVILLGVGKGDTEAQAKKLVDKIAGLRVFSNAEGKFDLSVLDTKGAALVVSQFTLYGSAKGGRRPDFTAAAAPGDAQPLYRRFCALLQEAGVPVTTGEFGASMLVELSNDGPVTLLLDTAEL
jgi:D-tyrosyl-tRNA(Tyr) deacylase